MMQRDWAAWHHAYDDPRSPLSRRLRVVQQQITAALDRADHGPIRALSLCAGQGRDLIGAVAAHARRDDVTGRLVEMDPSNIEAARAAVAATGVSGLEVAQGDAAVTDAYAGAVPAEIVLACGVFGNITDGDVHRTITVLPQLCAPGATVVWTRNRQPPDITPDITRWFEKHGFEYVWASPPHESGYGVGVHRYAGPPVGFQPGTRMFTFVGYDILRRGAPWPT
jgi:hypothetical protein